MQYQNNTIRVTISEDVIERLGFREEAERVTRYTNQTLEQALRGLVLSDAMRRLGNARETARLRHLPPISEEDILGVAERDLWLDRLLETTAYRQDEVLGRVLNGYPLPDGMGKESVKARLYAQEALRGSDSDEIERDYIREARAMCSAGTNSDHREFHEAESRYQARMEGKASSEKAREALARAREAMEERRRTELDYREVYGRFNDGYSVEIIGPMPERIGTCECQA